MLHLGLSASLFTFESCEGQDARLDCGVNLIKVVAANYGRRDKQTCSIGRPVNQVTKTDCILSSSLSEVAKRCEGKSSCSVPANNGVFSDPCVGTFKYLQVSYTCVAVLQPSEPFRSEVIDVKSANYGRSDRTTCSFEQPASKLNNITCSGPNNKLDEMYLSTLYDI
ncbi:L-rhamnose-binding lectin CSL3-like [Aplochiton taeniatus]